MCLHGIVVLPGAVQCPAFDSLAEGDLEKIALTGDLVSQHEFENFQFNLGDDLLDSRRVEAVTRSPAPGNVNNTGAQLLEQFIEELLVGTPDELHQKHDGLIFKVL